MNLRGDLIYEKQMNRMIYQQLKSPKEKTTKKTPKSCKKI